MKTRLGLLLFSLFLLNGCYATFGDSSLSPAQVLKMQEREETIINDQFQKKLEDIEGIWVQKTKNGRSQNEAFYKRGDIYLRIILRTGDATKLTKINDNEFIGECSMTYPLETVVGDLEVLSVDENNLSAACTRTDYITKLEKIDKSIENATRCFFCKEKKPMPEDIRLNVVYERIWPEDLKLHNSKFNN